MVVVNRGSAPFVFERERFEEGLVGARAGTDVMDGGRIDLDAKPSFVPGSITILRLSPAAD
jgi:hypothetical protein